MISHSEKIKELEISNLTSDLNISGHTSGRSENKVEQLVQDTQYKKITSTRKTKPKITKKETKFKILKKKKGFKLSFLL